MTPIYPGMMVAMPLEKYRSMRDFDKTREPRGHEDGDGQEQRRFVIQEHHATALHWDHRFEHEGVLLSFAVPKGTPPDPRVNHLAVHTEDHPIEYLDFDGEIPEGEYGGGVMKIWDQGTYELEKMTERELIVVLNGARARGKYALFQTHGKQWMIHRMDPPEDPERELLPDAAPPSPFTTVDSVPDGDGWFFEPAWGGLRAAVGIEGGRVAWAADEAGDDLAGAFPELAAMAAWQDVTPMVVEVEIVVAGKDGKPDPGLIERRRTPGLTRARLQTQARNHPATVVVCDVHWYDGHSLSDRDVSARRRVMDELDLKGPTWAAATVTGDGDALVTAVAAQGLAGVRGRRGVDQFVEIRAGARAR